MGNNRIAFSQTDLSVSPISLGTASFGTGIDEKSAMAQLDRYVALGGNFVDTARVYGNWVPGMVGPSERVIGKWMELHGCRKEIIISTKGAHPDLSTMHIPRMKPSDIKRDLQASLNALRTDYIELYFLHRDDPTMPVGEILDVLEEQRASGAIRYYGCSNWTLPRIMEATEYAKAHGAVGFVCNQVMLSLAQINQDVFARSQMLSADKPTIEYHKETGMNLMSYMAIGNGYFVKRAAKKEIPDNNKALYDNEANELMLKKLKTLCSIGNHSIMDFMIQYVLMQKFAAVPVTFFHSIVQMEEAFRCTSHTISEDEMKELLDGTNAMI